MEIDLNPSALPPPGATRREASHVDLLLDAVDRALETIAASKEAQASDAARSAAACRWAASECERDGV